ncbi:MAG: nitroreductase family protein [Thermoplasmata archaeon]
MSSIIETIKKRRSTRTYLEEPIENEMENILKIIESPKKGPFGNDIRLKLLNFSELERSEIKHLGTYGMIKGAGHFILSAITESERVYEDCGYSFEKIVLELTDLDLGTCWMGGTFKRASFADKMELSANEILPIISPVGYPARKMSLKESMIRKTIGANKRKPWDKIFFSGNFAVHLTQDDTEEYAQVLESVRLAPSASNKQPWRIVKESNAFHFFLKRTKGYQRVLGTIDLQKVDMGIAMSHFELSCQELNLAGSWNTEKPNIESQDMEYIVSWIV